MQDFLLPHLICPACLPVEEGLQLVDGDRKGSDLCEGRLRCPRCRRNYPISDGVAHLVPAAESGTTGGQLRYEEAGMVERYLWSHFADLCDATANGAANAAWCALLKGGAGPALDAGCAVGRLTFELAARNSWAVGCDLSRGFVKAARRLLRQRRAHFSLPLEGNLRETFTVELPSNRGGDNLDFVVADALRLPFRRETFAQSITLNLLDRVAHPLAHLYEINRVTRREGGHLLFASPFSWATSSAPEELWLGGKTSGDYAGSGLDNVSALLAGERGIIAPPWRIDDSGVVEWQMRSHRNHRELIASRYLRAAR